MSEYIPTTDEVQGRYVHSRIYLVDFPEKKARKEFDRWLAEHDRQVKGEAWDEGRNAEPVHDGDHDIYCSEYECFCGVYVNPYREDTE